MKSTVRGDEDYSKFLRGIGFEVTQDSNKEQHLLVNLDTCQYLEVSEGLHKCTIYATRPQVCRDYSCLDWAGDSMEKSHFVKHAKKIHEEISGTIK